MEITKPNDILVATINNPNSSTYDLMSAQITPDNTSLLSKDDYKQSNFIQSKFTGQDGKFNDVAFDNAYNQAASHYKDMSDAAYLKSLDQIQYSPFDITRPKDSQTFKVNVDFSKDINPFKQTYGRTAINSIDESDFSMRELAQAGKIYDPDTKTWSEKSGNDLGLIDKFFGDTLVYAQWDNDGTHVDPQTSQLVTHKKGDWKISDDGNLYLEKLGKREMYGKQVVNPMDMLTTDGSFANKFDIWDSDGKDKSLIKTTLKIAADIAPFFIPGIQIGEAANLFYVGDVYGTVKAAINMASVLPTFYKAFEGILSGDDHVSDTATAAEDYMAKFRARSTSDKAQGSLFSYESIGDMAAGVFSMIYEQRAMSGLSKYVTMDQQALLTAKQAEYADQINFSILKAQAEGKLVWDSTEAEAVRSAAFAKIPELQSIQEVTSGVAKALSLGYMALDTTSSIYGEALQSGYDRRTAGFAALASAVGQYGVMTNNRMGDWILDKTTGYTKEVNRALVKKVVVPYLDKIKEGTEKFIEDTQEGKVDLGKTFGSIKKGLTAIFNDPTELQEALFKNSFISGTEMMAMQASTDAVKGIIDTMSSLGFTKKQGSFGGVDNVFSKKGAESYLSSFINGALGGAMFELNTRKIQPWLAHEALTDDTKNNIYRVVANGQTDALIGEINKQRSNLGNKYLKTLTNNEIATVEPNTKTSQADFVADTAIQAVRTIDSIMHAKGLAISDSDIIKQSMLDTLIAGDFEKTKTKDYRTGIEATILDDFITSSSKIMDITAKIDKLSGTPEDKTKNNDAIKELRDESKIYEQRIDDIKSGKNAETYFTQSLLFLSNQVNDAFATVDKIGYTKHEYGKDFYSLPEDGLGITKKRVTDEWNEQVEKKDFRKSIGIITDAYLDYEKAANPAAYKYSDSYSEESQKTNKNLLNTLRTLQVFNTSPENKATNISNFINMGESIKQETGINILPWDVMSTDVADKIMNENLLSTTKIKANNDVTKVKISDDYLNEEIDDNGTIHTKKDMVKNILNNILPHIPSENLIYNKLADIFNEQIDIYNKKIDLETNNLLSKMDDNNRIDYENQIDVLNNKRLNVHLDKYEESIDYIKDEQVRAPALTAKQKDLNLSSNDIEVLNGYKPSELDKSFKSYSDILNNYAVSLEKPIEDLSDDEKNKALLEVASSYRLFNPGDNTILGLITSDNSEKYPELEKVVNAFIDNNNNVVNNFRKYQEFKADLYKNVKMPEIFKTKNYAVTAIIKEIKSSKNIDGELLGGLQKFYSEGINKLKNQYFKEWTIDNSDFIDLTDNANEVRDNLVKYINEERSSLNSKVEIPIYIKNLISSMDINSEDPDVLIDNISEIANNVNSIKEDFAQFKEIREILSNSNKFISNSIYDLLKSFELYLSDEKPKDKETVMSILQREQQSLFNASEITNYLSEELRDSHMQKAINSIKMFKSILSSMQTTELTIGEPYGVVASRQAFAKKLGIDSEINKLKTIDSSVGKLMLLDLERIQNKIDFLKELAKSNSGKNFVENEIIRSKTAILSLDEYKKLNSKGIMVNGFALLPDLTPYINSKDSVEQKQLNIEEAIYRHYVQTSKDQKIEAAKVLIKEYKYNNSIDTLYDINGTDASTKDIKELNKNQFLMTMFKNIAVSSKDMNTKILNILKSEDFDKSPFYTQELATTIAYATLVEPEMFAEASKENKDIDSLLTEYITYILGDAGTGKTTVVLKSLILMLKDKNPNMSIWFAAPHEAQSTKLELEVLSKIDFSKFAQPEKFNKQKLFEKLGIDQILQELSNSKDSRITLNGNHLEIDFNKITFNFTDLPNLILIDEGTHFTAIELAVMNEVIKRARLDSNGKEGVISKIITIGDPTQIGATDPRFNNLAYNVDRVSGTFTPQLTISVRSANSQKRANNDYLSGLTKRAIRTYKTENGSIKIDVPKILELIGNGMPFKYHLDINKGIINGDVITAGNILPIDILQTLKNIITKKPDTTIGILSNETDLDPKMKEAFDKVGITNDNYDIYLPETVQGTEADYFIFNKSDCKSPNITRSLRKLYTYMSRAKNGSIMINDADIVNNDGSILKTLNEYQSTTENIEPLNKDVVDSNKKARIAKLEELLGPNTKDNDNFKFNDNGVTINDDTTEDNILRDNVELYEPTTEEQWLSNPKNHPEDNFNYRVYTFYNDLNTSYNITGNSVTLFRNINSEIPYGLDPLFGEKDKLPITLKEFKNITKEYVALKYSIWESKIRTGNFSIPIANPFLLRIIPEYTVKELSSELVLRKTSYDDNFNSPYSKFKDDLSKHLTNGSTYSNLFLKVKINEGGKEYYIHLATLPKLETTKKFYDTYVKKDSLSAKAYEDYLLNGDTEISIDKNQFDTKTSTRLIRGNNEGVSNALISLSKYPGIQINDLNDFNAKITNTNYPKGKKGFETFKDIYRNSTTGIDLTNDQLSELYYEDKIRNSLNDLVENNPGLMFWGSGKNSKFTPNVDYHLFSTGEGGFKEFKEKYKQFTFGSEIPEQQLLDMYEGKDNVGYKGKPYAVVSFINDPSQGQIILLKSKTRTFDNIMSIIKDPNGSGNSIRKLIMGSNSKSTETIELHQLTDTLFSGNQVLDMLIKLAVKEPDLFNTFFKDGYKILEDTSKEIQNLNPEFTKMYMSTLSKEFQKDLLTHITYAAKGKDDNLRRVFEQIRSTLADYSKAQKPIDEKTLKAILLDKIRGNKTWNSKFWNFFNFKNTLEEIVTNELSGNQSGLEDLTSSYNEFLQNMNKIVDFWKKEFNNKIYYNVPIRPKEGGGGGYELTKTKWDADNLYTSLVPEGLYLTINLSKTATNQVSETQLPNEELKTLTSQLSDIKFNKRVILNSDKLDTIDSLKGKIEKAKIIKDIIEHVNNTSPISDKLTINDLKLLDTQDLFNTLAQLDAKKLINPEDKLNEVLTQIQSISTENTYKSDLLKTFTSRLVMLKNEESELSDGDKLVLNNIMNKWNSKLFPDIIIGKNSDEVNVPMHKNNGTDLSLYEYLNKLPDDALDITALYGDEGILDKTGVNLKEFVIGIGDEEDINSDLSAFISRRIGDPTKDQGMDKKLTKELFDDCSK